MAPMAATTRPDLPDDFTDLPNVGPAIAADLELLGFRHPRDLAGRDPYALYDDLQRITGKHHDPCVCDVFLAVVRYVEGGPKQPWWAFTAERKARFTER